MATVTNQILVDGPRNTVIKVIGDTMGATGPTQLINISTLTPVNPGMSGSPAPTLVRLDHIEYSISDGMTVELQWHATANVTAVELYGRGKVEARWYGGIQNNAGVGVTGNIDFVTAFIGESTPVTAGDFTLVIHLVKCLPNN